jgi:gliding motility-associated-like protein
MAARSYLSVLFIFSCLLLLITTTSRTQPVISWNTPSSVQPFYIPTSNYGKAVVNTPDGGYMVAGHINFPNGYRDIHGNERNNDAWLVKYNQAGQIEWQKNYGGSGADAATSIITTSDGGYLFAGRTNSNDGDVVRNAGSTVDVWIVKLDNTGIIQWQKTYGGSGDEEANSIVQATNGDYIFAGYTNSEDGDVQGLHTSLLRSDIWVVRLNATGSIIWQKCLGGAGSEQGRSAKATADGGLVITGQAETNGGDVSGVHGFTDAWVVKLNAAGIMEWQRALGGTQHEIGYSITTTPDGGYILCGETGSANGDVSFNHSGNGNIGDVWVVKLSATGTLQWEKTYGGTDFDIGYAIQEVPSGGYVVAGIIYSQNGDVSGNHSMVRDAWIFKISDAGALEWQKSVGGKFDDIAYSIINSIDGGFVFTGYTNSVDGDASNNPPGGGNQTWTVKLGKCGPVSFIIQPADQTISEGLPAVFKVHVNGTTPNTRYQWYRNGLMIPGADSSAYHIPSVSLPETGDRYHCIVTNCDGNVSATSGTATLYVLRPPECQEVFYLKTYNDPGLNTFFESMAVTDSNDVIVCGNGPGGFIFRLNANGTKVWELSLTGTGSQIPAKIIPLQDGNFLVAGHSRSTRYNYFLLKIDINGKTIWRKDVMFNVSGEFLEIAKIFEAADGTISLAGTYIEKNLSFNDRMLYARFDSNGNLLFSNAYRSGEAISMLRTRDFLIKDGFAYIIGANDDYTAKMLKGYLLKINNATGALVWTRLYDFNGRKEHFFQILNYGTNDLCIIGQNDLNLSDTSTITICNTEGVVSASTWFSYGRMRSFGKASIDAMGNILYAGNKNNAGVSDLVFLTVNPFSGIREAKHYPQLNLAPAVKEVIHSKNGNLYFGGTIDGFRMFVGKVSGNGDMGCDGELMTAAFGKAVTTPVSVNFLSGPKVLLPVTESHPVNGTAIFESATICSIFNSCSRLELTGMDTVCGFGDTFKIDVSQNKGCYTSPLFRYDTSYFSIIDFSNGVITLQAKKAGKSVFTAMLATDCDTLYDSLEIHVFDPPTTVYIGPDTVLCAGNTLVLDAGPGFSSYAWQNNSSGSALVVSLAGTYFVAATDACGIIRRDTVIVTAAAPIFFSVGPDRTKCNADTLQLHAPAGFLNYSWSNNYNISSLRTQTVVVNPLMDTTYFIKAEKSPGCFAFDTVRITVDHSPVINMGNDTSICYGDSIRWIAPAGFVSYQWNTGAVMRQVNVTAAGIYFVHALYANGCVSADTVKLLQVYNRPVVPLNHDSTLCAGSTRTLDAGNFRTYLWSNGSTARRISVNAIGNYNVEVTDDRGCKSKDSVNIKTILPLPKHFLPRDTTICFYQAVRLSPNRGYNEYTWQNNAHAAFIEIREPGVYWLEVTDNRQCKGRDSIVVKQLDCLKGFYVPNAFTPDKNGKNDLFKPLLFGNVKQYRFTVFSRWGIVVFESRTINEGWDGNVAGKQQDNGTFVWMCTYQFEGEEVRVEKGSVIVVR